MLVRLAERFLPGVAAALRRSRNARARSKAPLVQTRWGFRFAGPLPDLTDPGEAEHVLAIERLIGDADVFVDVGANVGFFTCLARSRQKTVVAVEPFALNVQSLRRNLDANGWGDVDVHALALAERAGSGTLYGRDTLASRVEGWAIADDPWRQPIVLATLDSIVGGRFSGASLAIKIDVEGGELDVMRGASGTLSRVPSPVWSVEIAFDEHHPGGRNPDFAATFDLFFSRGYAASTVTSTGERGVTREDVEAWMAAGRRGVGTMNYVFRPRG